MTQVTTLRLPRIIPKNLVQRKLWDLLLDWKAHSMDDLVNKTEASSYVALKNQIVLLRQRLRKHDMEIVYTKTKKRVYYRLAVTRNVFSI